MSRAIGGRTTETGAWERPAFRPVTPHVSTPPRPLVLKLLPKTASSLSFSVAVTSSRHRFEHAAGRQERFSFQVQELSAAAGSPSKWRSLQDWARPACCRQRMPV